MITAKDFVHRPMTYAARPAPAPIPPTAGMKVAKADIEKRIKHVRFLRVPESTHTVCYITLDNGFAIPGYSAAVDPALFDAALGEKSAYEDAFRQLYSYLAFLMLEAKHQAGNTKTFGNALKALKEGKRVTRKGSGMVLRKQGDSLTHEYFSKAGPLPYLSVLDLFAEDWTVL